MDYPIKREYTLADFARSARFEGVPFRQPERFPIATQNAARVFWWLDASDPERAVAWAQAALRAYFARGVPLDDPAALEALAAESGLDPAAARAAWQDERWRQRLRQVNDEALGAASSAADLRGGRRAVLGQRPQAAARALAGQRAVLGPPSAAPAPVPARRPRVPRTWRHSPHQRGVICIGTVHC